MKFIYHDAFMIDSSQDRKFAGKSADPQEKRMSAHRNREVLEYRGIRWRYLKSDDVWDPIGVKNRESYPQIYGSFGHWRADGISGSTPLAAVKAWAKNQIELFRGEKQDLEERMFVVSETIKRLRSKKWA